MSNSNYQEVRLTPLGNSTSTDWQVDYGKKGSSDPANYPVVQLPANTGPYLIHFKLVGNPAVKFAGDPIAIQPGAKPVAPGVDGQITAVVASSDGRDLFILDKNTQDVDLQYKIMVDNHGPLDPIIDNGGGTTPPIWVAYSSALLIGVAVAAFLIGIFVHRRFFARK